MDQTIKEVIDELEDSFYKLIEYYDNNELASWAESNVPLLLQLLKGESEIADMYRGLCK